MRNIITATLCSLMLLCASSSSHAQSSESAFEKFIKSLLREGLPFENLLVYAVGSSTLKDGLELGDGRAFGGAITFGFGGVSGIELRGMNESASGKNSAGDFSFDYSIAAHFRFDFPLDDSLWWVWAFGYEAILIDIDNSEMEIDDSYRDDALSVGTEFVYALNDLIYMSLGYYLRWIPGDSIDLQDNDGRRHEFDIDDYIAHQGLLGVGFKF